jgi:hypothetical protein
MRPLIVRSNPAQNNHEIVVDTGVQDSGVAGVQEVGDSYQWRGSTD